MAKSKKSETKLHYEQLKEEIKDRKALDSNEAHAAFFRDMTQAWRGKTSLQLLNDEARECLEEIKVFEKKKLTAEEYDFFGAAIKIRRENPEYNYADIVKDIKKDYPKILSALGWSESYAKRRLSGTGISTQGPRKAKE
jgi:hypothetical protein